MSITPRPTRSSSATPACFSRRLTCWEIALGVVALASVFLAGNHALLLNEIRKRAFKRTIQSISYLPHFLSWVLVITLFQQSLGGAGFVSNLLLWREAGYFDTASEYKPLLHLWSLAVEEQFYLVWPWVILLIPRRWLLPCIIAFIAIGAGTQYLMRDVALHSILPFTAFDAFGLGALLAWVGVLTASSVGYWLGRRREYLLALEETLLNDCIVHNP